MKSTAKLFLRTCSLAAIAALTPTIAAAVDHPFMVTSPFDAQVPFNVTLPTKTQDGKPVKTAVIKFVSADCKADAGLTTIGSAQITVQFNGQNGFYRLPFAAPEVFFSNVEFTLAQQTLMFADAGTIINFGISGNSPTCYLVFSGDLIVKDK